ncbi:hypothetical protein GLAREA_08115 [Glarea lozoyensis ATCC 20868]|uniref:Uncharacterized protein n=1 Tax=Glarea lozoyensis (strain ATCC 20868 / MF5171) TaxID=1116229 RepID=S3CG88_GLAL2|nr:uncharacterized protein GLAREA_08115 [Glarea lozoyensis ATCC 20868]EPE24264.1 hypothetical protein GLAREA_08115 [Glarea lozoyensis ATCC 20868]
MAAPFIGLGLKAADAVIDKHFHKIPDKYVHVDTYTPKNLPLPFKKKKKSTREGGQSRSPDDETRSRSPSPEYDIEEIDEVPIQRDIPRHSGAAPSQFVNPATAYPPQYSSLPPHVRTEYIPPPPIGVVYPPPPPPQSNGQFPPQQAYNQFPPPPSQQYPPSPPQTVDPSQVDSRSSRDHRHRRRSGGRDLSPEDDRRSRAPRHIRRSSPYDGKHTSRYTPNDDTETEFYRSRRPKHTRRSSPYEPPRNQEISRYAAPEDTYSEASNLRRAETAPKTRELNAYDEDYDIYRSRAHRPRMETRRSSSFHGRESNYQYTATPRDRRRRQNSLGSGSRRYDDDAPRSEDGKENNQFFTKSKEGLLSGALGAVVGGWAADRLQKGGSGRERKSSGKGGEDDKLLTLLGAAVGGLAVNALVEKREEGKARKGREERVRKDGRVYEWDDGYS